MATSPTLLRAFIRAAVLQSQELGGDSTPKTILEGIILGRFKSEGTDGKTLIRTTHAGHEVEFALPSGMGATEVMELAESAIQELERHPDPTNPTFSTRRIRRLRTNFAKA